MAAKSKNSLNSTQFLARKKWGTPPAITILSGEADFFKRQLIERFISELSQDGAPDVNRLQGPPNDKRVKELPLATVLDSLRSMSFLAATQVIVIEGADAFVRAHRDELGGCLETGFPGGHLVLCLKGKLDGRTKFAKAAAAAGWVIECEQPYDRPPPWEDRAPSWDSPLSHWLSRHAGTKGLELDPRTAFQLHERVGSDLELLDEELEKIKTYLGESGDSRIDEDVIRAVTGDLRKDNIFAVIDLFLEGRRGDAVDAIDNLFERGWTGANGNLVIDPPGIALPLLATLLKKLRSLRRAHAMKQAGATSENLIREGIVGKPFISRFERQLQRNPPGRLSRLFDRLYRTDRGIKTGHDARRLLLLLVAE